MYVSLYFCILIDLIVDVHPPSKIWVSGPHIEHLNYWTEKGATATVENGVVFDNCEIIFLGVKPDKLDTAIKTINKTAKNLKKKVLFVSMLAGKTINTIQKVCIIKFKFT